MTVTEKARRSDALFKGHEKRRDLCNRMADLEALCLLMWERGAFESDREIAAEMRLLRLVSNG